eukprot:TRINITY_DN62737_c0_g1_i1.p1 TRINITY_DN62737_c0_g1~~TRINITY_DN62737_c0_g1_i1.p1  ORF type:complete len:819 (+),score=97.70 TRINITY_DN62737_c0_g1_i1:62-2518(+)
METSLASHVVPIIKETLDQTCEGYITYDNMKDLLTSCVSTILGDADVDKLLRSVPLYIKYEPFLEWLDTERHQRKNAIESQQLCQPREVVELTREDPETNDMIKEVFEKFDVDRDGFLNQEEVNAWWAFCYGRPRSFGIAGSGEEGDAAYADVCRRLGASKRGLSLKNVIAAYMGISSKKATGYVSSTKTKMAMVPPVRTHYRRLETHALDPEGRFEDQYDEDQLKFEGYDPKDFQLRRICPHLRRLVETHPFVLDTSLRETTVGQLRATTAEDRFNIFQEVRRCGIKEMIVAVFNSRPSSDEKFLELCRERGISFDGFWAFSDFTDAWVDGRPDMKAVPNGLKKAAEWGIQGVVLEIDLADDIGFGGTDWRRIDFEKDVLCCLDERIAWALQHGVTKLSINLRDFPMAMIQAPSRVMRVVHHLATRHSDTVMGIQLEEGSGAFMPTELATWVGKVRAVMNDSGWKHGRFLVHVHKKYGMADAAVLECIAAGADGVWAAVCEEGAANGHASSCLTLVNLHRLGNPFVSQMYNLAYLRTAAQNMTKIVSGQLPPGRQEVYGQRALDDVLGCGEDDDNAASWFAHEAVVATYEFAGLGAMFCQEEHARITTISSPELLRRRLSDLFGDQSWEESAIMRMKNIMLEDLYNGVRLEYTSAVGLGTLYERAGGTITKSILDVIISQLGELSGRQSELLKELRDLWSSVSQGEESDRLSPSDFYEGFMGRYFGTPSAPNTQACLAVLDKDSNGFISWKEFAWRGQFVLRQFEPSSVDELLDGIFEHLLLPMLKSKHAIGPYTRVDYGCGTRADHLVSQRVSDDK